MRATTEAELEAIIGIDLDYEPDRKPRPADSRPWNPDLNPTQKLIFNDPAPFILAYGEKASGKGVSALYKLVRHCFENQDALALIITPSIRTGKFGALHDLESLVLPAWADGIGLEWLPSKLDPNTKDRVLKIANCHGGWSTVLQISIPYAEAIEARIKGVHPSFVFADELTDCESADFFTKICGQLHRRRNITGPQQYVAACNPKGPSHWVYQIFIEGPVNLETGERDARFSVYHVPFRENAHRPEMAQYIQNLELTLKNDPIERERLIDGKWVERPTGESLFKSQYQPSIHVVGDRVAGTGLAPMKMFPVTVGYDLGQVYHSAIFMQYVPVDNGCVWSVFDEIVHLQKKIMFRDMALEVVDRLLAWNMAVDAKMAWEHITDDSAVNQWRPGSGSYDAWEFENEFNKAVLLHGLPPMRMAGCPKGAGSISARVRIVQNKLMQGQLLVSAQCPLVNEMLLTLEGTKEDPMKPKKNVRGMIHIFDAMSYPMLKYELGGASLAPGAPPVSAFHAG